jgi:hypothetical protein
MLKPSGLSLLAIFLLCAFAACAQMRIVSLGVYSGITSTYTWDEGINIDPRYKPRYDVKTAPFGICFGQDFDGFGYLLTPGLVNIGQNYHMVNIVGGHEGTRKINLSYATFPIALKFHLIDLIFLKTSFIMGASPSFLLKGKEELTHNNAKFYFPAAVYPYLPSDYTVQYDGVIAPDMKKFAMLDKEDFKTLQTFGFIGIVSDWYLSNAWKVSFDIRAQYSFQDNRSLDYLERLENYEQIYDVPGKRRDIVLNFAIGVSRYIEFEKKQQQEKASRKGTKPFKGTKYPWPGPRKSRPRN